MTRDTWGDEKNSTDEKPEAELVWGKPDTAAGAEPAPSPTVFGNPAQAYQPDTVVVTQPEPAPTPAAQPEKPQQAPAKPKQAKVRKPTRSQPHWERKKRSVKWPLVIAFLFITGFGYTIWAAVSTVIDEVSSILEFDWTTTQDAPSISIPEIKLPTLEVGELTPAEQAACSYDVNPIVIPGSITITTIRTCDTLQSLRLGGGTLAVTAHFSRLGNFADATCRGDFTANFALCALRVPGIGSGKSVPITVTVPSGPITLNLTSQ